MIALDIAEGFRNAGASVMTARQLQDGLRLAGHPDLSAAVLDFGLSDGEGTALCERLKMRHIPFVLFYGRPAARVRGDSPMTISLPDWQGTFERAAVHMLGEVFDEVWARIAPEIDKSRDNVKFARNHLALIVIKLPKTAS